MKSRTTKNVVFDSFALLTHFQKEKGFEIISHLFSLMASGEKAGFISVITLGEIYYLICLKAGKLNADKALDVLYTLPLEVVNADAGLTVKAARLKARFLISHADAFAAALTIQKKATLVTGYPEFKKLAKEKDFKVYFFNR